MQPRSSATHAALPILDLKGWSHSNAETDFVCCCVLQTVHGKCDWPGQAATVVAPGYLRVAVEAAMTVDTREFVSLKDGLATCNRSTAMRFKAVLSSTTTASALRVRRLRVSKEL